MGQGQSIPEIIRSFLNPPPLQADLEFPVLLFVGDELGVVEVSEAGSRWSPDVLVVTK